jgi:hypothetical protein
MKLHDELVVLFNIYLKEVDLFEGKGVKSAAPRARRALLEMNTLLKERRKEIQIKKNEM